MARAKVKSIDEAGNRYRTPVTPEAEEAEMIAMATALAKKQLREGTASAQVITHYLKLGTTRERLEKEILVEQKKLYAAKTDQIETGKKLETLYQDAITAFTSYLPTQDSNTEMLEANDY